ncbi:MAG: glutathione S-transferase family protein [Pseudomonadota bacterium]
MYHVFGPVQTRTFRVLWALEELGLSYELSQIYSRQPEIVAMNPSGKVPVLKVGDDVITDSSAIMTYLADKHGGLIAPAGTIPRAKQDAMLHQVLDEIDAVLWTAARHSFVLPEDKRVPDVKPSLKWEFNRNLSRIADHMTGEFACGDGFTIVDIALTHCLNWAYSAKFDYDSDKMKTYAKNMRNRDAFRKVAALAKS